jgi:nucleotide-binding universal stress UspA family protein
VDLALTELVVREVVVHNFQLLNQSIYNTPNRFIQDFKVLAETSGAGVYRVALQATVAVPKLAQALSGLGIMLSSQQVPSVLLLIHENNTEAFTSALPPGTPPPAHATRRAMSASLTARGLTVVGGEAVPQRLPSDEEALSLARQRGADMVVVGASVTDIAANTMGTELKSFTATVDLRALQVAGGGQVGALRRSAVKASADWASGSAAAQTQAGTLGADALASAIINTWQRGATAKERLIIDVEGIGGQVAAFVKFRGQLQEVPGVKGMQIEEMTPDTARLSAQYQGSSRSLAEALMERRYQGFGINIYAVDAAGMKVQLVAQ